jgi:succinate dehydrogenase / fumarate reductase flavoprotein subunit
MGGLWVDYEKSASGGLVAGSPRNQQTNIPRLYAIGECDYQYHGANRLGANSLLSCIFSGLFVAPGIANVLKGSKKPAADEPAALFDAARRRCQETHDQLLRRPAGGENPYLLHQELGQVMTKAATVVRVNSTLHAAYQKVCELGDRVKRCSLSDTGNWTNQNVVFTKALVDMIPIAKAILLGAEARDECRGAHFKPDFSMPGLESTDPGERRHQAEAWCDCFEASTQKWLKSSITTVSDDGDVKLSFEDIDTSLLPPRPRLYGLVGAEVIEEVWKGRQSGKGPAHAASQPSAKPQTPKPAAVH